MADILKSVSSAFSTSRDARIDFHLVEKGSASLLTGIYDQTDPATLGFYRKPDVTGAGESTKLAVIYGEVMITPYLVDAGVESATNDPKSILKTYRFVTGEGTNSGVPTGPNGSPLENVYIKDPNQIPQPVVNSDGRPSMSNVILASALGGIISSAPKIWDAIKGSTPSSAKTTKVDPVTGKPILTADEQAAAKVAANMTLSQLSDVNVDKVGENYVLTWDENELKWKPTSINTLLGGAISSTTITGGAGGTGGTGGSGGAGGGGSTSGGTITTGVPYYSFVQTTTPQIPIVTTSSLLSTTLTIGYVDYTGASVTIGTATGTTNALLQTSIQNLLISYLRSANVQVTVSQGNSNGNNYISVYLHGFAYTLTDNKVCDVGCTLNVWIKDAGGNYLTNSDVITNSCAPCYLGNTLLKYIDTKAASTANISATMSVVSKTPTAPTLTARYNTYNAPVTVTSTSVPNYSQTSIDINGGGGVFYTLPKSVNPKIVYNSTTFDTTLSLGTHGSISALTPSYNASSLLTMTPPTWATSKWSNGCWTGSKFLMIGADGTGTSGAVKTMSSTDGITWTQGATSFPYTFRNGSSSVISSLVYGGGTYLAILDQAPNSNQVATSTDGITWTARTTASSSSEWLGAAWNGSVFCLVSGTRSLSAGSVVTVINTSPDGITWTARTGPANFYASNIIYTGSQFLMTGRISTGTPGAYCATSFDGATWTTHAMPAFTGSSGGTLGYSAVDSNGSGTVVAGCNYSSAFSLVYSTNHGSTWNTTSFSSAYIARVLHDSGKYHIFTGVSGNSSIVTDLITFSSAVTIPGGGLTNYANILSNGSNKLVLIPGFTSGSTGNCYQIIGTTSGTILTWDIKYGIGNTFTTTAYEVIPNGYGYDPATSTTRFEIPQKTKRLTVSGLTSIDGVAITAGDRILLKDQTDQKQNGIYEVINSTTLDLIYELCVPDYAINGVWTHITSGTVNASTDWALNSSKYAVNLLGYEQEWNNITGQPGCSTSSYSASGGGGGSPGSPGSAGSPGSPGGSVTINTTVPTAPTCKIASPASAQYGTQTVPGVFDAINMPNVTVTSEIFSTEVELRFKITNGEGVLSFTGDAHGATVITFSDKEMTLTGPAATVSLISSQVKFTPDPASLDTIDYTCTVTNADNAIASDSGSFVPTNITITENRSATAKVCVSATSTGGTGKVMITYDSGTLDLTNGYVAYSTSATVTAANIASNINANVAVKNALDPTADGWLPNLSASASGNTVTITAPVAGGADFNGIVLTTAVTGAFVFGDCDGTMKGGATKTENDILTKTPNWDKVKDVLLSVAGNVAGAVVANMIMNKSSQLQISLPTNQSVDLAFLYRGRIVKVPNEYDATNRTGHPTYAAFSGTYKQQYTNNPAWCLLDFIENKLYGLGLEIILSTAQKALLMQDIFAIGLYCDELVANSSGVNKPRFSINTVITEGTKIDILKQICSVFYGSYVFNNGGLRISYDKLDSTIKLLVNQANAGKFDKALTSSKNFINKVRLSYVEPSNFYTEEVVVAENTTSISTWGERSVDVMAFGCTDSSQAMRYASWLLNSEIENSINISYVGGLDHYNLMAGDIVEFYDSNERNIRRAGRIVSQSGTAVVLDAPIVSVAGDYFSLTCSDGSIHQTTIASISGANVVLTAAPSVSANPYATFIAAKLSYGRKLYKVIKITETSNSVYNVILQYYNPAKFATVVESTVPTTPVTSISSFTSTSVTISWTASTHTAGPGIAGYKIYKNGNTTTPFATVTSGTTYTNSGLTPGSTVTYSVAAYSNDGTPIYSLMSNVVTKTL